MKPQTLQISTLKKDGEWPIPHRIRFTPEKMSSISKGYETRDIQRGIAIDDTPHVRDKVCLVTTILHWTLYTVIDMIR